MCSWRFVSERTFVYGWANLSYWGGVSPALGASHFQQIKYIIVRLNDKKDNK